MKPPKVLIAAAEMTPLAKVGGLADVIGALPKALAHEGVEVRIIIPRYGSMKLDGMRIDMKKNAIPVPFAGSTEHVNIQETTLPGSTVPVWLVEHERYLGRGDVYSSPDPHVAETTRFTFFSRSVLAVIQHLGWWPDVLHCHDWHVSMIPVLIRILGTKDENVRRIRTLLTIHNLALQGLHNADELLHQLGIASDAHPALAIRDAGGKDIIHLAAGILTADKLNTVSPTYAREILTPQYGVGLEKFLEQRKNDLTGILNGIDVDRFNPETDPQIAQHFSSATTLAKKKNTLALQKLCHLPVTEDVPVVGIVSRLTEQKGLSLVTDRLLDLPFQLVVLGTGEHDDEERFTNFAVKHSHNVHVQIGFDAELAQQIYAGADLFLMPSQFEPCGLGQMIAMRYGTIPIVRRTGGLADTVRPIDRSSAQGDGFVFDTYAPEALEDAVQQALALWKTPDLWHTVIERIMKKDFSWTASAQQYLSLYQTLLH